ncbi:unnamed protein product [Spirodela intermedia]|uniref:Uncharacterized protein n=2 Tax=Spirodela intermedia TaxID=51605 RepID=A0A7I8IIL7_SPIIN|nr:unnamed protein product [Spirodela intermedia]CAA6657726.1 unnamed protein product [Spirodela intermedia]CAA7393840.1 unnamed protein product [Spirodela intermedia]
MALDHDGNCCGSIPYFSPNLDDDDD